MGQSLSREGVGNAKVSSQTQAPPPCASGSGLSSPAPCPVAPDGGPFASTSSSPSSSSSSGPVYNVYNQRIDTAANAATANKEKEKEKEAAGGTKSSLWNFGGWINTKNNMPLEPNQQPSAGQRKAISTERQDSTIPKGGTNSTWKYPSPQMFFNALTRKDKADGVEEDDMENVVFFHNGMNEITWDRVKRWEALHYQECSDPKLTRFRGRPHDLSPLARVRSWFSGEVPFDRHDWYVDRCGKEVRYVIDFYFDEEKAGTMEAFEVQARPALDDIESCVDRLKMNIYTVCAKYGLPCPISGHESTVIAKTETETVEAKTN